MSSDRASFERDSVNAGQFTLRHPIGLSISSSLTEAELAGFDCPRNDMRTGWVWYQLPAFQEDDVLVGIALGFNLGKLEQVTLSDTHNKFGSGWDDWSEQKETLRAKSIGDWLSRKGFPSGSYAWGVVWCGYDPRGGFGAAFVQIAT
jgi:hypothetical protein